MDQLWITLIQKIVDWALPLITFGFGFAIGKYSEQEKRTKNG